ncbi:MAG: DUF421 domain-containing protein [Clostridia bacterium]|nr:DUF421 domain-containing protein [Clostridia bacterium]
MIISLIRTLILYILIIIGLRVMGKRQIGELQPGELVVAILLSDLAAVPMSEPGIPLLYGIIPIFTLVVAEMCLSYICLKSEKIRSIITDRPSVIMADGVVDESEMRKLRFNLSDLTEELRLQGFLDISQIDTAILETNGSLTLIPKSEFKMPDCGDMNIKVPQDKLPFVLISDGKLNENNLKKSGFDYKWLESQIKLYGAKKIDDVFYLTYYMDKCHIQLKGEKKRK